MIRVNLVAANFSITPVASSCKCGGRWTRTTHSSKIFTVPVCSICKEGPAYYRLRKSIGGVPTIFTIDSRGRRINPDNAIATSRQIDSEIRAGEFDINNYRQNTKRVVNRTFPTVSEYIHDQFLGRRRLSLVEREFLEDFMAPYFVEVGSFTFNEFRLHQFLDTFRFRDERRQMAVSLFNRLRDDMAQAA